MCYNNATKAQAAQLSASFPSCSPSLNSSFILHLSSLISLPLLLPLLSHQTHNNPSQPTQPKPVQSSPTQPKQHLQSSTRQIHPISIPKTSHRRVYTLAERRSKPLAPCSGKRLLTLLQLCLPPTNQRPASALPCSGQFIAKSLPPQLLPSYPFCA
ncbi:hypothetical protein M441DRAFT_214452 [Trichoderma asperellum CBS 433.97]|uniref:Uncharacterized protein n=1 Tax=Trichoderma asperellum (strain ATCC 204424 / CBS 433.97 / NBRC 101777) TaxID=1042311 RepID=A0A2T3ZNH8_TRIA4|nr:hypothetical protein M441DRAFT_214452 [Trichoderma asperellum CBS 433.97]PTB46373.1 hypothetical protein M441DRAFT_214452 [Trichoderma asperellum CBS 433.97]